MICGFLRISQLANQLINLKPDQIRSNTIHESPAATYVNKVGSFGAFIDQLDQLLTYSSCSGGSAALLTSKPLHGLNPKKSNERLLKK